jgi:threonine aldolase
VHLDGARIWNAAVALATKPATLAAGFDSVMCCLSKGLGAPVGSLLCGTRELVAEAREVRRLFGGAMRQVGVLAAAGRVALAEGPAAISRDHENARRLAAAIAETPGLEIDPTSVQSNILMFRVVAPEAEAPASEWCARARERGLLAHPFDLDHVRLVTHRDLSDAAVASACEIVRRLA